MDPEEYADIVDQLYKEHLEHEKRRRSYYRSFKYRTPRWEKSRGSLFKKFGHIPPNISIAEMLPEGMPEYKVRAFLGVDLNILFGMRFYDIISEEEFAAYIKTAVELMLSGAPAAPMTLPGTDDGSTGFGGDIVLR